MFIFGHRFIKSDDFYHITDIDAISNTPPNSTIVIDFNEDDLDIIDYAFKNEITFALNVRNITEIIYASSLNTSYIIIPTQLAKTAQNIANNYLFDAKILVHVEDEAEIEELALLGVDGVIFSNALIKISS